VVLAYPRPERFLSFGRSTVPTVAVPIEIRTRAESSDRFESTGEILPYLLDVAFIDV
jgi:hypothetical protein